MTLRAIRLLGVAIVAAAVFAAPPHSAARTRPAPGAVHALHDIGGIADVRAQFEQDRGHVRIVMLLSPT